MLISLSCVPTGKRFSYALSRQEAILTLLVSSSHDSSSLVSHPRSTWSREQFNAPRRLSACSGTYSSFSCQTTTLLTLQFDCSISFGQSVLSSSLLSHSTLSSRPSHHAPIDRSLSYLSCLSLSTLSVVANYHISHPFLLCTPRGSLYCDRK